MNTNRAEDQARPAGRPALARRQPAGGGATDRGASVGQQPISEPARIRRRWSVRVHWGIVFAIVASLILWLAIKTLIGLMY